MCLYQNKTYEYFLFRFKIDNHMQIQKTHEGTDIQLNQEIKDSANVNNSFVILSKMCLVFHYEGMSCKGV